MQRWAVVGIIRMTAATAATLHIGPLIAPHDDRHAPDVGCPHDTSGDQQRGGQHDPSAPCNGNSNCQGVCTYLPPQKMQFEIPLTLAPLAVVSTADAMADRCNLYGPAWLDALFCTAAAPHVRLHLAQQVLLI
jgi:hypothetical protein